MTRRVEVARTVPFDADAAWAALREFCAPWHFWIETMEAGAGGRLRSFTVAGDSSLYVERLTWFSDTERSYRYACEAGIDEVSRYAGSLQVAEAPDRGPGREALVTLSAEIDGPEPRVSKAAEGTQAVFETGLAALAKDLPEQGAAQPMPVMAAARNDRVLDGTPKLALTEAGQGPLVLFLHGIGGSRSNWDFQIEVVGATHRAVALDLRGYGGSALGDAQSAVDDHCADIDRVRLHYGAETLVLVGLSFGAWLATCYATRHQERVAGLVVAGGCTGMSEAPKAVRQGFRDSRLGPLDAGQTPADFAEDVVQVIAGPEASTDVREALRASMAAIPPATYRDAVTCFTDPPGPHDFSRLSCPVLLMTGEHDRLAPPAEIKDVAERIHAHAPFVQFEVLEGAGHVCNLEMPKIFARHLLGFLNLLKLEQ